MKKIKLMIVGCGAIAEKAHLPSLRRISQVDVAALVDINLQRAKELKSKYLLNDAEVFDDYLQAMDKIDTDAVLILTPPATHLQLIKDFSREGKNIFCEKPIATNLEDAKKIANLITKTNKFMIGFQYRFLPQLIRMRKLVKSGEIGKIISMISIFSQDINQWPSFSEYQYKKELGGGALFDSGTHYADLMKWILGDIEHVECKVGNYGNNNYEVDDAATMQLYFKNGSVGTTHIIWCGPMMQEFYIIGNNGILKANDLDNHIQVYKKNFWILPPVNIRVKQIISPYHSELMHFFDCIQNNREIEPGINDAVDALKVILAAYKSTEVEGKVKLSSI